MFFVFILAVAVFFFGSRVFSVIANILVTLFCLPLVWLILFFLVLLNGC